VTRLHTAHPFNLDNKMRYEMVLYTAIGLYILFMLGLLYFFIIRDPSDSKIGRFFTETIPETSWRLTEKYLPKRVTHIIAFLVHRILALVYLSIMCASISIVVWYVLPLLEKQEVVGDYHRFIAGICFVSCLSVWRKANTSSPGLVTSQTLHLYRDNYPYDNTVFIANTMYPNGIPRLARSKYDRFHYKQIVPRFDHFCGWVANTVGMENYRWFLLFLLVQTLAMAYGGIVIGLVFYGHLQYLELWNAKLVDRTTGEVFIASKWMMAQFILDHHTMACFVWLLMSVMSVCLALFLTYHIWLTSNGLTTNEANKWDQVRKWYRHELRKYEAVYGTTEPVGEASRPVVVETDVTCTGGAPIKAESREDADESIRHPGPEPTNIYNRGFVENWKEVFFPLSLRKPVKRKET